MTTITAQAAKLLEHAEALLYEHGWTQHTEHDVRTGSYCLVGVLKASADELYPDWLVDNYVGHRHACVYQRAAGAVSASLERRWHHSSSIENWNDRNTTTADDVMEVLKLAHERLEVAANEQAQCSGPGDSAA